MERLITIVKFLKKVFLIVTLCSCVTYIAVLNLDQLKQPDIATAKRQEHGTILWNLTHSSMRRIPRTINIKRMLTNTQTEQEYNSRSNIILFWTFQHMVEHVDLKLNCTDKVHFDCGLYQCDVTANGTYLNQSKVIVFKPRATASKMKSSDGVTPQDLVVFSLAGNRFEVYPARNL